MTPFLHQQTTRTGPLFRVGQDVDAWIDGRFHVGTVRAVEVKGGKTWYQIQIGPDATVRPELIRAVHEGHVSGLGR